MKKGIIIIIGIIVVLALVCISSYNSLITKGEEVDSKFAKIDTYLQRRADLIPNLVSTVKGYASHEESVINKVVEARAKLSGASTVSEKAEADEELSQAISRLLVITENYPDLKASTNFTQLQDELAGTENRIATARKDYNDAVEKYNGTIKKFPSNLFASIFGIEKKEYFKASETSREVPNVQF